MATLPSARGSAELAELTGRPEKMTRGFPLLPWADLRPSHPSTLRMRALALLVWAALAPTSAFAQCAISGLVSSSAGGPVPGAAVEARSPALIKQVRRATTDMSGRYRLEGLPPGTCSLLVSAPTLADGRYEGLEVRAGSTTTHCHAAYGILALTPRLFKLTAQVDF